MHIIETKDFEFENGKRFQIRNDFDCDSSNLLYYIKCLGCSKGYIGQTGDKLRNRVRVHRQHINDAKYRILEVSRHIAKCSTKDRKFDIIPFYKMNSSTEIERECKEEYFINIFRPSLNSN